ncbi:hypothetical protein [Sphingobium olei]|uniref:Uncharacterized protein n=1 Tax=Sphingobium olei TaxID=420955 RepID=A0ABW3NX65_9SPHN|nr:hypothetical protein [Sphingobium sp.]
MQIYGYQGGTQRIVAIVQGKRKVIAWGDDITEAELAPFRQEYGCAWIERVTDEESERAAFPTFGGRA